jgi:DNA ligase-1
MSSRSQSRQTLGECPGTLISGEISYFLLEAFSADSPALGSPTCVKDNLDFTGHVFGIRFNKHLHDQDDRRECTMADLADGESVDMQGSGSKPYVLRNISGVYSCSCPAWRNQSVAIENRTCKHLKKLRGEAAEVKRVGSAMAPAPQSDSDKSAKDVKAGPPLLLAENWDESRDYGGWWMSEKLDGVRAYWTGSQFLSRQGNLYHAPDWFIADLPDVPLDGELWLGRKQFQRSVSIVRRQDKSDHWKEIQFLIFDAPASKDPFEQRIALLHELAAKQNFKYAQLHQHLECRDNDHLVKELERVEALGGEGLMLRQPGSNYETGRSQTLVKVKTFQDAEARVVGHQPGLGRHKGQLGALLVELADGTQFSVGTGFSDAQRRQPPQIGATINFRYQELSDHGVPRFPSYVGVRMDVAVTVPIVTASNDSPKAGTAKAKRAPKAIVPKVSDAVTSIVTDTLQTAVNSTIAPNTTAVASVTRMFEFQDGKADKFWEITTVDKVVTVRYGRRRADAQTNTKNFADIAAAQKHASRLIEEKTSKGYVEVV